MRDKGSWGPQPLVASTELSRVGGPAEVVGGWQTLNPARA